MIQFINKKGAGLLVLLLVLVMFILSYFLINNSSKVIDKPSEIIEYSSCGAERENIVFILGKDSKPEKSFYREAENFYRFNNLNRAEILINSCQSIYEMRDYLAQNPPANGLPWGTIEAVTHSNQYEGMSVPVVPEGKRTTIHSLQEGKDLGIFDPFLNDIIDSKTKVIFYGCGLGNNQPLLESLSELFVNAEQEMAEFYSPKQFIHFTSDHLDGMPINTQRYLADYYQIQYPSYYHPGNYILSDRLKEKYKEVSIDWNEALSNKDQTVDGEIFSMEYKIPLTWFVPFHHKDERPKFINSEEEANWIQNQTDLIRMIQNYDLSYSDFRWTTRNAKYENENGEEVPTVKIMGYCSIVTILKPNTEETSGLALTPDLLNSKFYTRIHKRSDLGGLYADQLP